jgi:hypothetical protein
MYFASKGFKDLRAVPYFILGEGATSNNSEEAIITAIKPGPDRTIDESLALEFLNVRFRIIRPSEYENKVVMVAFKDPPWLLELEPAAPLNGYVMQQGEFAPSLVKDDRVAKGLKVSIEVSDF